MSITALQRETVRQLGKTIDYFNYGQINSGHIHAID